MSAILKSASLDLAIWTKKKTSLIHSVPTLWWQPSWILPSWIQQFCTKLCLKTNSFFTQLDDVSHLEFCHLGFSYFAQQHFTHTFWLILMMAAILEFCYVWIQPLPSWIQTPCYLLSDALKNTLMPLWLWLKLIQSDSNSFILNQLEDVIHLEFCHLGFSHFAQK